MRSDQYIGLNSRAQAWLLDHAKTVTIVTDTKVIDEDAVLKSATHEEHTDFDSQPYSHITGAWNDNVANLMEYNLKDGGVVRERIQAEPWSSGPMYFIALYVANDEEPVKESLWTDEELENEGELPKELDLSEIEA